MPPGLLDGITVLDLASVGPGARASRWLADFGADVVKVGAVPSREGVQIAPPLHAYSGHRGMKRMLVDLKDADGREAFLLLARRSDVVIESFRPGVVDRLGIAYSDLRAVNPAIVYCSTTGYGQDGPYAGWAGHDLNYLAVGGFLHCTGRRQDGQPPVPGATVADSAGGGMHAVMSILAALLRRASAGEGAYLDVSVVQGVVALMALQIDEYLVTGDAPGPGSGLLTGRLACYDTYRCADGKWLSVAAIEGRFWANLCGALGVGRWVAHQHDDAVQDEIRADLRAAFAARTRDQWVADLGPLDTCVAPVLSVEEVVSDPHLAARGILVTASNPTLGAFSQVGPVLAGMDVLGEPYAVRDPASTDAEELLLAAGLSPDEVDALKSRGVVT